VLYLSLLPLNSKPLNPVFLNLVSLNPALLKMNLKLKLKNTVKPFRIYLDYWRFIIKAVNNFKEEEVK